jgi:hypothetical protein
MSQRNSVPRRPQQVLTGRRVRQIARTGTGREKADLALALHTGQARVERLRPEDARHITGASHHDYYAAARRQQNGSPELDAVLTSALIAAE